MMMMMLGRGTIALQVSLGGRLSSLLRLLLLRPAQGTRSDFVGIHHRLASSWSAGPRGCGQRGPRRGGQQDGGDVLGNLAGGAGAC